jgi:hypothetical protein
MSDIIPRGQVAPTGHDWRTAEGQQALARLLLYGAQAGSAVANIAEVMRRHTGPSISGRCRTCNEIWAQGEAAVEGCSIRLLADAIEGVLWVASNKPPEETR